MRIPRRLHSWDLTPAEAMEVQRRLASQVVCAARFAREPKLIAGTDISGAMRGQEALGAVVVVRYPELTVAETATARVRPPMPYIPGLLSFRETPVLLQVFERLKTTPDLIVVDGHGLAHPRRFGIACHIGLLLGIPTLGCAKSILTGRHDALGTARGSVAPLLDKGEVIGAAVRTQDGVTPVYVSIGHRIDLETAVEWVLKLAPRYRLPETTRLAHEAASGRLVADERTGRLRGLPSTPNHLRTACSALAWPRGRTGGPP